ncbi:MAG: hypothetical protein IPN60_18840 [Saprospiraceae bacterium]|nr:hypothetical protein [Candidatus Opimibacter skivensis]
MKLRHWCDIESFYFSKLKSIGYPSFRYEEEFSAIKTEFINYLRMLDADNVSSINAFNYLFSHLENLIVINFNYTSTIEKYIENAKCINIHGHLSDNIDDIIFGYNANSEETAKLRKMNDNNLLKNLKSYNYKNSDKYDLIKNILRDRHLTHEVWVIGHSCGYSDKVLLKEILEYPTVRTIRVFYHNNFSDLINKVVQIENITDDKIVTPKIKNKMETLLIPQANSDYDHLETIDRFLDLKFSS